MRARRAYDAIAGAIESGAVRTAAGPGGIYARRVGGLCFGVAAMDRTFEHEGNPTTVRLRVFAVSNPAAPTHAVGSFSVVLPQRPEPEPSEPTEPVTETPDVESAP